MTVNGRPALRVEHEIADINPLASALVTLRARHAIEGWTMVDLRKAEAGERGWFALEIPELSDKQRIRHAQAIYEIPARARRAPFGGRVRA